MIFTRLILQNIESIERNLQFLLKFNLHQFHNYYQQFIPNLNIDLNFNIDIILNIDLNIVITLINFKIMHLSHFAHHYIKFSLIIKIHC